MKGWPEVNHILKKMFDVSDLLTMVTAFTSLDIYILRHGLLLQGYKFTSSQREREIAWFEEYSSLGKVI